MLVQLLHHPSGGSGSGPCVSILQSTGSFFAYAPILRALQNKEELPLHDLLVQSPPAQADMSAGRWAWWQQLRSSVTWAAVLDSASHVHMLMHQHMAAYFCLQSKF